MTLLPAVLFAAARVVTGVGDPSIAASIIKPFIGEFAVTAVTPDGHTIDAGTWIDRVTFADLDGRRVIKREQICNAPAPRLSQLFTVWIDATTLAPVRTQMQQADGLWYRREFRGTAMTVKELGPSTGFALRERQVAFEEPVFDFYGGAFGLLLAALPLDVGKHVSFPVYTESDEAPFAATLTAEGLRREAVDAGALGRVEALVVRLPAKSGVFTAWVIRTAPYVVRLELAGPRGGRLILAAR